MSVWGGVKKFRQSVASYNKQHKYAVVQVHTSCIKFKMASLLMLLVGFLILIGC